MTHEQLLLVQQFAYFEALVKSTLRNYAAQVDGSEVAKHCKSRMLKVLDGQMV